MTMCLMSELCMLGQYRTKLLALAGFALSECF